jgi:hypothetical protein
MSLLLLLWLHVLPAHAYEDYSVQEGMSCSVCHKDTRTYLLTPRGREYKRNGYSFTVKPTPLVTPKPGTPGARSMRQRTPVVMPLKQLMTRSSEVLQEASRTLAVGYYEKTAEAASELNELAGKIEAAYRPEGSAAKDLARLLRDACFRLERTLRTGEDSRPDFAPLQLGRVVTACLRCHHQEGISQEDWSRDRDPQGHGPRIHRHRPDSRSVRPEGALPSRARNWNGIRR